MLGTFIQLVIFAVLLLFAAFLEYLDWHGRADVLKDKHPRVWAMVNSRPARLVVLVASLSFLTKDFRDAVSIAPPPVFRVAAPIAPNIRETPPTPVATIPPAHTLTGFLQISDVVPNVKAAVIAPQQSIAFNLFFMNKGTEPVSAVFTYWELSIIEGVPSQSDEQKIILKKFRDDGIKKYRDDFKAGKRGPELGVGDQQWATLALGPLNEKQATGLLNGAFRLYLYAWGTWKDAEGYTGKRELCEWLQSPLAAQLKKEEMVWHSCSM